MNNRQNQSPSHASAWWFGLLLGVVMLGTAHDLRSHTSDNTKSVEQGAGIDEQAEVEADISVARPEKKLAFAAMGLLGLYCLLTAPRRDLIRADIVVALALLSIAWVFASYLWSESPGETSRELIRVGAYTFTACAIALRFSLGDLARILTVVWTMAVIVAAGYDVLGGTFKPIGEAYRLSGSLHANKLATYAGLAAVGGFAMSRIDPEHRRRWLMLAGAMLVALLLTKSRSSVVACAVGVAGVYWAGKPIRQLAAPVLLLVALLGAAVMALGVGGDSSLRGLSSTASLGRDEGHGALTGRLPLWDQLLVDALNRPLEGHGYGAYWNVQRTEAFGATLQWFPRHAHNAYLETLLNVGLIGVLLATAAAAAALFRSLWLCAKNHDPGHGVVVGTLATGFVNGMSEAAFVLPTDFVLFGGVLVMSMGYAGRRAAPTAAPLRFRMVGRPTLGPC